MDRENPNGIPRDSLAWALTQPAIVAKARRMNSCLLCCGPRPTEAGVCERCQVMLSEHELRLVERWHSGSIPG